MIGMRRGAQRVLGAGALALLLSAGFASAAVPAGPRLAVIKNTSNPARSTLITVGPNGGSPVRLAGGQEKNGPVDSFLFAALSWRPDGAEVAYTANFSFFLAGVDGSGAHRVNAAGAEVPVFAPDGHTVAFTRAGEGDNAIWTIDLISGEQRQLTPSRRSLRYVASSFSPDGTTLLATRVDRNLSGDLEPVALNLVTGGVTRLRADGYEPVYSPDGSKIALLREVGKRQSGGEEGGSRRTTDLFVLNAANGSLRRLTRTPYKDELFPSWDPSGQRIAFTRFRGSRYDWANSIVQINADGSCETELLSRKRTVFYGAAWQPGPGREAGPIDC
jgi:Tol biopolymer transport system component